MKPLKITCNSVDCIKGLHCFLRTSRMTAEQVGGCRACGVHAVDWERVGRRDPADAAFTFEELRKELIRHHMWEIPFDAKALDLATRRGRIDTYSRIASRLRSSIGKPAGAYDSRQTPMEGNVIYYAQHATATCCRKCLGYWHGIDPAAPLDEAQLGYCSDLVKLYLDARLPDLADGPRLANKPVRPSGPRASGSMSPPP